MNFNFSSIRTSSLSPSYTLEDIPDNQGKHYIFKETILWVIKILLGIVAVMIMAWTNDSSNKVFFIFLVIVMFAIVSYFGYIIKNKINTFDTEENAFYTLNKKTQEQIDYTVFSEIIALEISVEDDIDINESSLTYTVVYTLSLILDDEEITLESHSNHKRIKRNANTLSKLIGKPVRVAKGRELSIDWNNDVD